jgi:ABC-type multidrug transport system fused ATPase/permease subunit
VKRPAKTVTHDGWRVVDDREGWMFRADGLLESLDSERAESARWAKRANETEAHLSVVRAELVESYEKREFWERQSDSWKDLYERATAPGPIARAAKRFASGLVSTPLMVFYALVVTCSVLWALSVLFDAGCRWPLCLVGAASVAALVYACGDEDCR